MSRPLSRFATHLSAMALGVSVAVASGYAASAAPAVENKEVATALLEAKRLAGKKQWTSALAAIRKARAVPAKSTYADYKIDEYEAYLLTQQRKYSQAAEAFERLALSTKTPAGDVSRHWQTAAQLFMQTKSYDRAASAAARALESNPQDLRLLELLGQSQYLAKHFRDAAPTLEQLVHTSEKQRQPPREEWLQMLLASYHQLSDQKQIARTWESLLAHYPKTDYWRAVLKMKAAQAPSPDVEAGYRRLMFEVGVLQNPTDYEELALDAIDAGAPSEAVRVLEMGFDNGIFFGAQEARYKRMLEFARRKVAQSGSNVAQLTATASSLPGESSIKLGRLHLGRGDYDKAIDELRRGIEASTVEREDQARIDLGIAFLKSDQSRKAHDAFASVDTGSEWHDLATLWDLRASGE